MEYETTRITERLGSPSAKRSPVSAMTLFFLFQDVDVDVLAFVDGFVSPRPSLEESSCLSNSSSARKQDSRKCFSSARKPNSALPGSSFHGRLQIGELDPNSSLGMALFEVPHRPGKVLVHSSTVRTSASAGEVLLHEHAMDLGIGIDAGIGEHDETIIHVRGRSEGREHDPARRDPRQHESVDAPGSEDDLEIAAGEGADAQFGHHDLARARRHRRVNLRRGVGGGQARRPEMAEKLLFRALTSG